MIMESSWTINLEDNTIIYGTKNSANKFADSAIFIVHGLTGHMNEYAIKRAADYFHSSYDVYRFNLYDGEEGARQLINCSIKTHADDLNTVLSEFSGLYKKIFLIGHSYGGTTIMCANPSNITAVSLWDPSFNLNRIQKDFVQIPFVNNDYYVLNWGNSYLIGKDMYDEAGKLDENACINLAKDFLSPVQVIHAGDGLYVNDEISYHSFGNKNNIRDIVPDSVHCFYEKNTCDVLLDKTEKWFIKNS